MAYTQIHSVRNTFEKSLAYIKNPKKTTFIGNKNDLNDAMRYIKNPNKTKQFVFVEGYLCDPTFCENQFLETKEKYLAAHGGKEPSTISICLCRTMSPQSIQWARLPLAAI